MAALSLSPVFRASRGAVGAIGDDRGLALRFPRFIRAREDKGLSDATSSLQLADMFSSQPEANAGRAADAAAAGAAYCADAAALGTAATNPIRPVDAAAPTGTMDAAGAAAVATASISASTVDLRVVEVPPEKATLEVRGHAPSKTGGKFWAAAVRGVALVTTFGKVGTKGKTKTAAFGSGEEARVRLLKMKAEKEKKEYTFDV